MGLGGNRAQKQNVFVTTQLERSSCDRKHLLNGKLKYVFLLCSHASEATILLCKIVWKDHLCLGVGRGLSVAFFKKRKPMNFQFLDIFLEFRASLQNTTGIYNQSFLINVFVAWKLIRGKSKLREIVYVCIITEDGRIVSTNNCGQVRQSDKL